MARHGPGSFEKACEVTIPICMCLLAKIHQGEKPGDETDTQWAIKCIRDGNRVTKRKTTNHGTPELLKDVFTDDFS